MTGKKFRRCRSMVLALALAFTAFSAARSEQNSVQEATHLKHFKEALRHLVYQYYPTAEFLDGPQGMLFTYKAMDYFDGPPPTSPRDIPKTPPLRGPSKDGIFGEFRILDAAPPGIRKQGATSIAGIPSTRLQNFIAGYYVCPIKSTHQYIQLDVRFNDKTPRAFLVQLKNLVSSYEEIK